MIRFGSCIDADVSRLPIMKEAGFDYAEPAFCEIQEMSDDEFSSFKAEFDKWGVPAEACCRTFPGSSVLMGAPIDFESLKQFFESGMKRVAELGVKVMVFGSGKQRAIPEGMDWDEGIKLFSKVVALCGDTAAKHGIKVAIEPLQKSETNLINTVAEGVEFVKKLNHPNVFTMVDLFHAYKNGEDLQAVIDGKDYIAHAHIARNNPDRVCPHCDEDIPACKEWAEILKKAGYNGRLSLEGSFADNFAGNAPKALKIMQVFNK